MSIEVIVADDGSGDHTQQVVEKFANSVEFPVRFVTHPRSGFQLARCRNEGAAVATAPRLLFLDGDCLIPPGHIAEYMNRMRPGTVYGGYCVRFDEATSRRVTNQVVRRAAYVDWTPPDELRKLNRMHAKAAFYQWIGHPTKPKLFGGNIGVFREDFERVNGFDEAFCGWGCEDDDFRIRLRQEGIGVRSILKWTRTYHLWHPPAPSKPPCWRKGANVARQKRRRRLTRCLNGLWKRSLEEIHWRLVGKPARPKVAESIMQSFRGEEKSFRGGETPWPIHRWQPPTEVEVLFLPGKGRFSAKAQCRVLVVMEDSPLARRMARRADIVIPPPPLGNQPSVPYDQREEFDKAIRSA